MLLSAKRFKTANRVFRLPTNRKVGFTSHPNKPLSVLHKREIVGSRLGLKAQLGEL